jgi:hypothetical protein
MWLLFNCKQLRDSWCAKTPAVYLWPGPKTPLWRTGMAVAHLNLSGCAHWAEGMHHCPFLLEGLLLHTLDLSALLAPSTRLAAHAPFTWHPAFREKPDYFQCRHDAILSLLKQLLWKINPRMKALDLFYNQPGQVILIVLFQSGKQI